MRGGLVVELLRIPEPSEGASDRVVRVLCARRVAHHRTEALEECAARSALVDVSGEMRRKRLADREGFEIEAARVRHGRASFADGVLLDDGV